jgi:hypothetical protein
LHPHDHHQLKIDTSCTLRENPKKDWREEWDINTFFKALEETYALDSRGRFLDAPFIWRTLTYDLCNSMDKMSESFVAFILEKNFLHPIPTHGETQTPMR